MALKFDRWDVVGLMGTVLIIAGLWMIWPPLALVATGALFVAMAILAPRG